MITSSTAFIIATGSTLTSIEFTFSQNLHRLNCHVASLQLNNIRSDFGEHDLYFLLIAHRCLDIYHRPNHYLFLVDEMTSV